MMDMAMMSGLRTILKAHMVKKKLYRKSYYVDKIVNSTTFKIAKRISYPISFFKKNFSNRKYRKFLIKFLYKQ